MCLQPVHLHGSLGREAATGRGTVFATRELLKHHHEGTIAGKSIVIQVRPAPEACFFWVCGLQAKQVLASLRMGLLPHCGFALGG
jgi:hypothetical protein